MKRYIINTHEEDNALSNPATPTALQFVDHPLLLEKGIELFIKREDLRHPQISGNKWHKLKYNLQQAIAQDFRCVASFGGAWSNHLHALAYAGQQQNLRTIGFVRGELPQPLNAMLADARSWGMQLVPLSYGDYRRRHDADFVAELMADYPATLSIPEGGANQLAVRGCAELAEEIVTQNPNLDILCAACGTGATLAGLIKGINRRVTVLGFSTVKGNRALASDIEQWLQQADSGADNWQVVHDYHCGGFAKLNAELVAFMDSWREHSNIPLEPIYTGKMLYGLFEMIRAGQFAPGTSIVALHSGGLQGLRGMAEQMDQYR